MSYWPRADFLFKNGCVPNYRFENNRSRFSDLLGNVTLGFLCRALSYERAGIIFTRVGYEQVSEHEQILRW